MVQSIDPLTRVHFANICDDFKTTIKVVKARYNIACHLLVIKLKCRFLDHELKILIAT